jgi:hypothetical protein
MRVDNHSYFLGVSKTSITLTLGENGGMRPGLLR